MMPLLSGEPLPMIDWVRLSIMSSKSYTSLLLNKYLMFLERLHLYYKYLLLQ